MSVIDVADSSRGVFILIGCLSWTPSQLVSVFINTLRLRQNGRHFTHDIFKCIFLNRNVYILIKSWLKCVPQDPINSIPALVQMMAWHQPGNKPLSEPMMVSLHIYESLGLNELRKLEHVTWWWCLGIGITLCDYVTSLGNLVMRTKTCKTTAQDSRRWL